MTRTGVAMMLLAFVTTVDLRVNAYTDYEGHAVDQEERFDPYFDEALQQTNDLNDLNLWNLPLHHLIIRKSQMSPSFRLRFGRRSDPKLSSHILEARNVANTLKTSSGPKSRDKEMVSNGEVSDLKSLNVNYELIKSKNKVGSQLDDLIVDGVMVEKDSNHPHMLKVVEKEQRLLHDALCSMRNLVTDGQTLHGDQATVVSCALACAADPDKIGASEQDALRSLANVLEAIPMILAGGSNLSQADDLTKATASWLAESTSRLEIDCTSRGTMGMEMQNMIESFEGKHQQILLGIQLLRSIL